MELRKSVLGSLAVVVVVVAALSLGGCEGQALNKINGIIYVNWDTGGYSTSAAEQSEGLLGKVVLESQNSKVDAWTSVLVTYYQTNINSTSIAFWPGKSPNDSDIVNAVTTAKRMGLKVALKPHVDLSDDPTHWRGNIGLHFNDTDWALWFTSYSEYLQEMAVLADSLGVDLLIIGTELSVAQTQESYWREIVTNVRGAFGGPLVYGANYDAVTTVSWWDALDYIGIDAYFALCSEPCPDPAVEMLVVGWSRYVSTLENLQQTWGKPIIFTELGYCSTSDTAYTPWAPTGNLSIQAQTNCYEAFYQTIFPASWFQGVFWWSWTTNPTDGGLQDTTYTPNGKPASSVISSLGSNTTYLL